MILTIHVDPSWLVHAEALGRILDHVRALEAPAPYAPRPVREPGQDDTGDDLAELLAGMDDASEPSPAPSPAPPASAKAPRPSPAPAAATPPARDWDGTPRTGRSLYRWACDRKALPDVNRVGKAHGYPKRITDWEPGQVAAAYAILTSEPVANSKAH
jgi:hypothetical protein